MKRAVLGLVLVALTVVGALSVRQDAIPFRVHLIWATDGDQPPSPGTRRADPQIAQKFRSALRWRNYWEIRQQPLTVSLGHKTRVRLSPEREVEVDLSDPVTRKVTAFWKHQPVARTLLPLGPGVTLIGGDRDRQSAWFIAVQRDEPAPAPAAAKAQGVSVSLR